MSKRARVQSRSSEREPEGNLDGFLGRLHAFPQNEGQAGSGSRLGSECKGTTSQYRKDCIDQRSRVRASSNVRLDIGVPRLRTPREAAFVWQSPCPEQRGEK